MFNANTVINPDGTKSDVVYDNKYGVVQYIRRIGKHGPNRPKSRLHIVRLPHSKEDPNYRDHVVSVVDETVTLGLTEGSFENAIACAENGILYSMFENRLEGKSCGLKVIFVD